jgi:hypothetical protein
MAKENKKSEKEASDTFHNIIKASAAGNPKQKKSIKKITQKEFIKVIKEMPFTSNEDWKNDKVISLEAIYELFPSEKKEEVNSVIKKMDVTLEGDMSQNVRIPAKYFQ